MKADSYRPFLDVAIGVVGAVLGAIVMRSAGLRGYAGTISTAFEAMVAAVLLTLLVVS